MLQHTEPQGNTDPVLVLTSGRTVLVRPFLYNHLIIWLTVRCMCTKVHGFVHYINYINNAGKAVCDRHLRIASSLFLRWPTGDNLA